jgi:hypothetical protein
MSTTRDGNCEERIAAHMEGREQDAAGLFAVTDGDSASFEGETMTDEEAYERLWEWPLSVEVRRYVRIQLSTGGPGDWLDAEIDEDGEVIRVDYHFNDWFDHAERPVNDFDALYRLACHYVEGMAL